MPLHILFDAVVSVLSPGPLVILMSMSNVVPFLEVDLSLFTDDVRESSSKTLDGGHGVHDVLFAINVSVQHTQNVLKVVGCDQRLQKHRQSQQ